MARMNETELSSFLTSGAVGYPKVQADAYAKFLLTRLTAGDSTAKMATDLENPPPAGLGLRSFEASNLATIVSDEWNRAAPGLPGAPGAPGPQGPAGTPAPRAGLIGFGIAAVLALILAFVVGYKVLSHEKTSHAMFDEVAGKVNSIDAASAANKQEIEVVKTDVLKATTDATDALAKANAALAEATTAKIEARTATASATTANNEIAAIKTSLTSHAGAIDALNGAMNGANAEISTIKTTLGNQGIAINDLTTGLDETNDKLIRARRSLRTISKELVIVKKATVVLPPVVAAAQPTPVGEVTVTDE